ncbi:hypothetical protein SARC_02675 [Sphaeroforma arctica JP610]|uniref:Mitochondrial acidic protein MAM33 n=1 Tax=Sphaeroforma arctica JP610 TaxID=667725 RepID=A0A0L0G808_9EUKA|nr:hypothetical protein SARC_02675 [Sphaeroforma arctica JP610]KNC85120.1 hypothetical protein SARC_02675 [Sphaeroforma arctica JP610]|eukprot:XP_014159022.1 hypothetical protein SARC_02675 [Sphaeroforma arctica JP610]
MQAFRQLARTCVRVNPQTLTSATRSMVTLRAALPKVAPVYANKFEAFRNYSSPARQTLNSELNKEIAYEVENAEVMDGFQDALAATGFSVKDSAGNCNLRLEKLHDDEKITVLMKIELMDDDEPEEPEDGAEDEPRPSQGVYYTVVVTKNDKQGALCFDMVSYQGSASIETITYNPSADSALSLGVKPEGEFANHQTYCGPNLQDIEESLEGAFGEYLMERGINDNFALICEQVYREKEQKEYVHWLKQISEFTA